MTPTHNEASRPPTYTTQNDAACSDPLCSYRAEIESGHYILAAGREPLLAIIQRFLDRAYHVWGCGKLTEENCTCGLWQLRAEARALIKQDGRTE